MKKCIWGMGRYFDYLGRVFPELFIDDSLYFSDSNISKYGIKKGHVISRESLYEEKEDSVVYVCATDQKVIDSIKKSASMYPSVKEIRHINELIQPFIEYLSDSFKSTVINNICDFEQIYAFEPDPSNYHVCGEVLKKLDRIMGSKIHLFNAGCYEKDGELLFDEKHNGCSNVSETGDAKVAVRSIDSVLDGQKATYIKMDIEGSELYALRGAKQTIIKWHPKLAICILS